MRRARTEQASFPPPLFFFLGDLQATRSLFEAHWPEAPAISDPEQDFFKAFGLSNMTWGQIFHPGSFIRAAAAMAKGHWIGSPKGQNPFMRSGVLLVRDRSIVWRHDYRHAGDHPNFGRLPIPAANRA